MKLRWRNRKFSSLPFFVGKNHPYESWGVIKKFHFIDYLKLGKLIVSVWIIPWIFKSCQIKLSIPFGPKIKYLSNQLRYTRSTNFKYSKVWVFTIIVKFIDNGNDDVEYDHIHGNMIYGIVSLGPASGVPKLTHYGVV